LNPELQRRMENRAQIMLPPKKTLCSLLRRYDAKNFTRSPENPNRANFSEEHIMRNLIKSAVDIGVYHVNLRSSTAQSPGHICVELN
jgi:hypothetical protein